MQSYSTDSSGSSFPSEHPRLLLPCLFVALLLCVVGSGLAVVVWLALSLSSAQTEALQATSPPVHADTPAAREHSDSTAPAAAGAPARATATSAATATAQAVLATVRAPLVWPAVISETFAENVLSWRTSPALSTFGSARWTLADGVYTLDLQGESGLSIRTGPLLQTSATDSVVSVDLRHTLGSDEVDYGLVVRDDGTSYYAVLVNDAGDVFILLRNQGAWKTLKRTSTRALRPGQTNQLTVLAIGDQIRIYMNNTWVDSVTDGTLARGTSGVSGEIGEGLRASVEFDNFVVRVSPTAIAEAAATVAARAARATGTAQAALATAASRAQWPVVISDTFSTTFNQWPTGRLSDSFGTLNREISMTVGTYTWDAHAAQGVVWRFRPNMTTRTDFSLAVDAQRISGTLSARYGLTFRDNGTSYYKFMITDERLYSLWLWNDARWTSIIAATRSSAIRPGGVNRLAVQMVGAQMLFIINGEYVAQIDDGTLSSGRAGLSLDLGAGDEAVIEFRNFELRAPGPVTASATRAPALMTADAVIQAARATAGAEDRRTQSMHAQWPLVFSDTFGANTRQWPLADTNAAGSLQARLGNGIYHWQAQALSPTTWVETPAMSAVGDLALTAEVTLTHGPASAQAGLIAHKTEDSYLLFEVRGDRTFRLVHMRNGTVVPLIQRTFSGSILVELPNRLTLLAEGSRVTLYINDDIVGLADDDAPARGSAGLSLSLEAGDDAAVDFSRFELHTPP